MVGSLNDVPVGVMIGSAIPPEQVGPLARLSEELGFGEIWIPEDYFFTGGISGAAVALASTSHIPVGFGIVASVVRHPAVLAMELATLSRVYPGRVWPGIGLGVPLWLGQMGLRPKSQLAAVEECVTSVRKLVAGEELTAEGSVFRFDKVKLVHPAEEALPFYVGIMGPKMLELSGKIADGTLIGVSSSTKYATFARQKVTDGATKIGRTIDQRFPCLVIFSIDNDAKKAKETVRPILAFYFSIIGRSAYTDTYGNSDELVELLERGGLEGLTREMPDQWIEDFTIAGDPEECAGKVKEWLGHVDSVVLYPMPVERGEEMLRLAAEEMLPRLG